MEKIKTHFNGNAGQVIMGAAIILAVIVGGIFYTTKTVGGNTLTVTGSAKMSVVADNVIWRASISRSVGVADLKTGYTQMANDLKIVQAFITKNGIDPKSITTSPVVMNQEYQQDQNAPKRYNLYQSFEINSKEVDKVTVLAKNIDEVINLGVLFQTDGLEYYYSALDTARVNLLTNAITDAHARAAAMAKSSGSHVGKLASASSGVVQVLSKGAVDNGDYGQYDTSKIDKDISVTVRATFKLK